MFATPPMHQFNLAQCASAPICPSPLASTQNTTTPTSPPIFSVPTTPPKRDSIPSSRSKSSSSYAQRYANTIANPMGSGNGNARNSSTSPVARAARREAFLNRVKQGRDDARFAGRGEQLVLLEHVKEQKMWGEKMSRGADGILRTYLSELEDGSVLDEEVQALDEYLLQEERELAELENMESSSSRSKETGSFSDDEYEDLFMDLADQSGQDMDMSG